jgi:cell division protein FtsZ
MINISMVPEQSHHPRISVIGVGGAGGNAVANMIQASLIGVNFVIANTDVQALDLNPAEKKIKLGTNITEGLGAGANPEIGAAAAEESFEEIQEALRGSHMVFITAGMGGGTGSGAAPVVARAAKELGILTVAVVTKPFSFEGARRMHIATAAVEELQQYVDTVIMIPNQNLFRIATERTTLQEAFKMADDVLYKGVRGVTDLMVVPGFINLDFNDIKTVMSEMGQAMMGAGEAEGERRAIMAAEMAISSPLLDGISMQGARGVLINITGGDDMTLYEVDEAANRIREEVDPDANIIFGTAFDSTIEGRIRVSVVATGLGGITSKKTGFQDRSLSTNSFGYSTNKPVAKKPEPQKAPVQTPVQDTPAEVTASAESFLSSSSSASKMDDLSKARKEKEDTSADFDDLEIPAFLRRQAN